MKRVMIIGSPGAGKSVFARRLHELTGLPLYHLDSIWHKPDRTNISREEFDARLDAILAEEEWIVDGNYRRTIEKRLAVCDTVILMDYPTEVCLSGAAARVGTRHPDLPWVETELNEEFRQYILRFREEETPRIYELIGRYLEGRKVVVFHDREESEAFLRESAARRTCDPGSAI